MGYFIIIVSIVLLYLCFKLLIKPFLILKRYKQKHGNQIETYYFPLIGSLSLLKKDFTKYKDSCHSFFRQPVKKNPNIKAYITNIGPYPSIYLCDPKLIKEYCINYEQYQKFVVVLFYDILVKESLLAKDGDQWKKLRATISPLFINTQLKNYVQSINICGKELIEQLKEYEQKNQSIPLVKIMEKTTGDVVSRILFGEEFVKLQINGQQITNEFASLLMGIFNQTIGSPWTIIRNLIFGNLDAQTTPTFLLSKQEKILLNRLKAMRALITEQVNKRINTFEENQKNGKNDLFQILIGLYLSEKSNPEIQNKFSIEHIVQNAIQFYGAGIHTTANVLSFAIYYLGKYPEICNKVKLEIDQFIGDELESIDYEKINQLSYLHAFVNETMRHSTPAPQFKHRRAVKDHYIDNIFIEKGTFVNVLLLGNFSNQKHFLNPEEFRPERWLEGLKMDEYIFIPFNAGPKNCIGQQLGLLEIKIIIVFILKNYQLFTTEDSELRKRFNGILYTMDPNDCLIKIKKN